MIQMKVQASGEGIDFEIEDAQGNPEHGSGWVDKQPRC